MFRPPQRINFLKMCRRMFVVHRNPDKISGITQNSANCLISLNHSTLGSWDPRNRRHLFDGAAARRQVLRAFPISQKHQEPRSRSRSRRVQRLTIVLLWSSHNTHTKPGCELWSGNSWVSDKSNWKRNKSLSILSQCVCVLMEGANSGGSQSHDDLYQMEQLLLHWVNVDSDGNSDGHGGPAVESAAGSEFLNHPASGHGLGQLQHQGPHIPYETQTDQVRSSFLSLWPNWKGAIKEDINANMLVIKSARKKLSHSPFPHTNKLHKHQFTNSLYEHMAVAEADDYFGGGLVDHEHDPWLNFSEDDDDFDPAAMIRQLHPSSNATGNNQHHTFSIHSSPSRNSQGRAIFNRNLTLPRVLLPFSLHSSLSFGCVVCDIKPTLFQHKFSYRNSQTSHHGKWRLSPITSDKFDIAPLMQQDWWKDQIKVKNWPSELHSIHRDPILSNEQVSLRIKLWLIMQRAQRTFCCLYFARNVSTSLNWLSNS